MTIKGVHIVAKRKQGQPIRWYVYAWRGGPQIMAKVGGTRPKLTPEAVTAYHDAITLHRSPRADTIAGLATAWRKSPEWAAFADTTRKQWAYRLSTIEEKWGGIPLAVFEDRRMRAKIVAWRDSMADHPRKADYHITVLRSLLAYGRMLGALALNVADGVPTLYKGGNRADIIWEPDERAAMEARLSQPVADAFRLACLTGLRRADLVALPWAAVGDHAIVWRTQKSRRERVVSVPMIPALVALLSELRQRKRKVGVGTVLVSSRGTAWTPDGLDSSFGDERDALGFAKHLHDCRGTYATELCLTGELTDQQVAGIMGWAPTHVGEIRRLYVDQARTVVAIGVALTKPPVNPLVNQAAKKEASL